MPGPTCCPPNVVYDKFLFQPVGVHHLVPPHVGHVGHLTPPPSLSLPFEHHSVHLFQNKPLLKGNGMAAPRAAYPGERPVGVHL